MNFSFFKAAQKEQKMPLCVDELMDSYILENNPLSRDKRIFLLQLADEAGARGIDINSIGSYRTHDIWAELIAQGCGREKIIGGRRAFVANKPNPIVSALVPALSAGLVRPRSAEIL